MGDKRGIGRESIACGFSAPPPEGQMSCVDSAGSQGLDQRCGTSVLVVAAEPSMRRFLASSLASCFALMESAGDTVTAEALLARCHFDLLISAIRLPERSAPKWVRELRSRGDTTDVLYVATDDDRDQVARAAHDACSCLLFAAFRGEVAPCRRVALRQAEEGVRRESTSATADPAQPPRNIHHRQLLAGEATFHCYRARGAPALNPASTR